MIRGQKIKKRKGKGGQQAGGKVSDGATTGKSVLAWFSLSLPLRMPGRKEVEGPREEAVQVQQRAHRRG